MQKKFLFVGLIMLVLTACGSIFSDEPVGIGRDRDALKQSPCACDEIRQDYRGWSKAG